MEKFKNFFKKTIDKINNPFYFCRKNIITLEYKLNNMKIFLLL